MSRYKEISKLRKKFDIVTNWIHYPIASYLCALISYTTITPNQVTIMAVLSELSAIYFIVTNFESTLVLIVVLLHLGWIFDLMDGVLARYKKVGYYDPENPSNKGYYFDAVSDHILKFMIIGALAYELALNNEIGWLLGLTAIIIHGITQTEHTLREMIHKSGSKSFQSTKSKRTIMDHIALMMNNIYLFYLVFIPINRIDLFLLSYAVAELLLFIKRVVTFWIKEP